MLSGSDCYASNIVHSFVSPFNIGRGPTKRERTRGLGPILGLNLPSKGHCIKAKGVDLGLHSSLLEGVE